MQNVDALPENWIKSFHKVHPPIIPPEINAVSDPGDKKIESNNLGIYLAVGILIGIAVTIAIIRHNEQTKQQDTNNKN